MKLFGIQKNILRLVAILVVLLGTRALCVAACTQGLELTQQAKYGEAPDSPGNFITFTISLTNASSCSVNPTLSGHTPENTVFVGLTAPADFVCDTPAFGAVGSFSCTGGNFTDLAPGTFQLVVRVDPKTTQLNFTHYATVTYPIDASMGWMSTSPVSVTLPNIIGNGIKEGAELCDDGNLVDGDGCSSRGVPEEMKVEDPAIPAENPENHQPNSVDSSDAAGLSHHEVMASVGGCMMAPVAQSPLPNPWFYTMGLGALLIVTFFRKERS